MAGRAAQGRGGRMAEAYADKQKQNGGVSMKDPRIIRLAQGLVN